MNKHDELRRAFDESANFEPINCAVINGPEEVSRMLNTNEWKPLWDGKGLPPVGWFGNIEDTAKGRWYEGTVDFISDEWCVFSSYDGQHCQHMCHVNFERPEADSKEKYKAFLAATPFPVFKHASSLPENLTAVAGWFSKLNEFKKSLEGSATSEKEKAINHIAQSIIRPFAEDESSGVQVIGYFPLADHLYKSGLRLTEEPVK